MERALGVDIGGTNVKMGFVDRDGRLTGFRSFTTPRTIDNSLDIPILADEIDKRMSEHFEHGNVIGIGVGIPGLLNEERTMVRYAVNLGLKNIPLAALLQARWNRPVTLDSDVIMGALGERGYGSASEYGRFLYVSIGTGVGACLFENTGIYRNAMGGPLNVGHMTIHPEGIACPCGNRGCLERYVSGLALVERYVANGESGGIHSNAGDAVTVERVCQLAEKGDLLARKLLSEAGEALGIAFVNLFQLFGACPIIVGGGLSRIRSLLLESAAQELLKRGKAVITKPMEIRLAAFPDQAGVLGAASAAFGAVR